MLARLWKYPPLGEMLALVFMMFGLVVGVYAGPPVMPGEEDPVMEVEFAPGDGPVNLAVARIKKARHSIDCMAYYFTDQKIADALQAAVARGCVVRVIVDGHVAENGDKLLVGLRSKGVNLRMDYEHPIQHNNLVIVDRATVITGSYNLTTAATSNAENCLVVRDNRIAARYVEMFRKHWEHAAPQTP